MSLSLVKPIHDLTELPGLLKAALATLDEHAIVAITDRHGKICYANRRFCELSGYTRGELIGQDHRILNSGFHSHDFMKEMWRTIGHGHIWRGCFCNRAKNGSIYWVQSTIVPLLDQDNKPSHYISMRTDVTDLKAAELALRDSEQRFRNLFEQSADALLLLDIDRGVFLEVNSAAASMLGYPSVADVLQHNPAEFSPPCQPDGQASTAKARQMIEQAREKGSHRFEWLHCSQHRTPFPVEVVLTMLHRDAGSLCLTTWRDITERQWADAWQAHYTNILDALVNEASAAQLLETILQFARQQSPHLGLAVYAATDGARILHIASVGVDQDRARRPYSCPQAAEEQDCALLTQRTVPQDVGSEPVRCSALSVDEDQHLNQLMPILSPQHEQPLGNLAVFLDQPRALTEREHDTVSRSLSLLALVVERIRIKEQQQFADVVFRESQQAIVLTDQHGRMLTSNAGFDTLFGISGGALTGTPLAEHIACLSDPTFAQHLENSILVDGRWQGEITVVDRHGLVHPVHYTQTRVVHDAARYNSRIHILADLSDSRRLAERINRLSYYDELTRLPNRVLMNIRLEESLHRCQQNHVGLTLLCIDLDRFKEVNDVRGHSAGDVALNEVANRFRQCLGDHVLARTGGDEFAVICENADQQQAAALSVTLQHALGTPLVFEGQPFVLGASIGIAVFPRDGRQPEELLRKAEIAMYRAKSDGAGHTFYQDTMGQTLSRQLAVANRLKQALKANNLQLHYQPLVLLSNRQLVGAEALLRWHDPEYGDVSPTEFIAIAEARNMMPELGAWVFERACQDLQRWREQGLPLPCIAVNLSALQFADTALLTHLASTLQRYRLAAEQFELEITESSIILDPDGAIEHMKALVKMGFSLSIDDFGTGYSSLSYLKRFPASKLKIDQSFVRDMLQDSNDRAIVETIIAMAATLNLRTVAEGVETADQAGALSQLGCDYAQGWLYAKALPAEHFSVQWLNT